MLKSNFEPHIFTDSLFPFHLDKTVINKFYSGPLNWHLNIELIYCISGSGMVICDTRKQNISTNEIVVVNSQVSHGVYTNSDMEYYYLIIDDEFCQQNGISSTELNFLEHISNSRISKSFLEIADAVNSRSGYPANIKYAIIRCAVLRLLILLCEEYTTNNIDRSVDNNIAFSRIKDTMIYIQNNYAEQLTLDVISSHVGVCKNHLSRIFKEYTNMTIVEYINYTRCKYAQMHILNNDSIALAASSCGFNNLSYFSRTYKKYIGRLPSQT